MSYPCDSVGEFIGYFTICFILWLLFTIICGGFIDGIFWLISTIGAIR